MSKIFDSRDTEYKSPLAPPCAAPLSVSRFDRGMKTLPA